VAAGYALQPQPQGNNQSSVFLLKKKQVDLFFFCQILHETKTGGFVSSVVHPPVLYRFRVSCTVSTW
jgi:hypothetical protein